MQRTNVSKTIFTYSFKMNYNALLYNINEIFQISNFEHWIWIYYDNMFLFLFYLFWAIFLSSCRVVSKFSGPPAKLICLLCGLKLPKYSFKSNLFFQYGGWCHPYNTYLLPKKNSYWIKLLLFKQISASSEISIIF